MVDVFISYSRSNQDRVRVLADAVRSLGYAVWWDDELPPHKSYGDVISEKIAGARAAIVCWSGDAAQSEWVRAEADLARNQKKLIQISYDDVMPPMPFNQIQFASLADWQGQDDHPGWRKVQASLADLCGPADNPRPLPPPVPPHVSRTTSPTPTAPAAASNRSSLVIIALTLLTVAVVALGWYVLQGRNAPPQVVNAGRTDSDELAPGDDTGADARADTDAASLPSASPAAGRFTLAATIDDPDGYTNVRAGPGVTQAIVRRINRGEAFLTFDQNGSWWEVQTADGTTGYVSRSRIRLLRDGVPPPASGPVAGNASRSGQIFPDSGERLLSKDEIARLGPAQLRIARNEIYARRGRRFQSAELRNHFSRFDWYRPVTDDVRLNSVEQANVDALAAAQQGR